MITKEEALNKILEHTITLPSETVPLLKSGGRIISKDLFSVEDLPPFDNSAMDGYAVRAEDVAEASKNNPVTLKIREVIRAGSISREKVEKGEAMTIMTGASFPAGADTVVIKEVTQPEGDSHVQIFKSSRVGNHIRRHGEDIHSGDILLKKGTLVRSYEVALLAAQGIIEIPVVRKPVVTILSTGDELIDPSERLSPGLIRNSNGPAIAASLSKWNIDAREMSIVRDDPDEIEAKLKNSLSVSDVVIISGGVSVGDYDFTREILKKVGLKEVLWKIAIKPGKPFLFGVSQDREEEGKTRKLVFGLPGNPVSVIVGMEEFVRPALEKLQGNSPGHPSYHLNGIAMNDYPLPIDRQQCLFCNVEKDNENFNIKIIRPQGSAMMAMACRANAMAISPVGMERIKPGDNLKFRWLK